MHVNEGQNCPSNHNVGPYADPDDCSSLWNCEDGCAIKSQVLMAFVSTSIFGSTFKDYSLQNFVFIACQASSSNKHDCISVPS